MTAQSPGQPRTDALPPTPSTPALVRAVRPRQWVKNLLVLAAPAAAGAIDEPEVLTRVAVAFVAFCLVSSAVYLFNDVHDVEADRRHPTKRLRPVAAGELSPTSALVASGSFLAAGMLAASLAGGELCAVLATYVGIQIAYAVGLKHQPVVDLACVSSGFLLRAVAGGVAADIALSQWFLLVAGFGSLFMVAGKRYSELHSVGRDAQTRRSLDYYSESYLRFVWGLSAGLTVMTYSLWAFGIQGDSHINWEAISIAPFVLGLLRYAADIDRGLAGAPEEILLRDRGLQVIGFAWIVLVGLGIAGVG